MKFRTCSVCGLRWRPKTAADEMAAKLSGLKFDRCPEHQDGWQLMRLADDVGLAARK